MKYLDGMFFNLPRALHSVVSVYDNPAEGEAALYSDWDDRWALAGDGEGIIDPPTGRVLEDRAAAWRVSDTILRYHVLPDLPFALQGGYTFSVARGAVCFQGQQFLNFSAHDNYQQAMRVGLARLALQAGARVSADVWQYLNGYGVPCRMERGALTTTITTTPGRPALILMPLLDEGMVQASLEDGSEAVNIGPGGGNPYYLTRALVPPPGKEDDNARGDGN